jgi:hypothetical protein
MTARVMLCDAPALLFRNTRHTPHDRPAIILGRE